jgi:hypothetical protein
MFANQQEAFAIIGKDVRESAKAVPVAKSNLARRIKCGSSSKTDDKSIKFSRSKDAADRRALCGGEALIAR